MAELPPQFVVIDGLANFRDIGGWPIDDKDGKTISRVRKGVFYRGPDTVSVTPAGLAKLRELNITTDFDLRSKGQIAKTGGASVLEGIERVWAPAFPDEEYSPEKAAARYVQYSSDGTEVRALSSFPPPCRFRLSLACQMQLCGHMTSSHASSGADPSLGHCSSFH
jgi:hypothetical protein